MKLVSKPLFGPAEAVEVRYLDVVSISIVEPSSRRSGKRTLRPNRGKLAVRLTDGSEIALAFPRRATLKMRARQHQAWKRIRAARARAMNEQSTPVRTAIPPAWRDR